MNRHATAHAYDMLRRAGRRWCSTTRGGSRHDHLTLDEAHARADDLAAILASDQPPAGAADRLTVWYRDEGDPTGWHTYSVIYLRQRAGLEGRGLVATSDHRLRLGRVQLYIEPRDAWVGVYVDPKAVYILLLPFLVIRWDRLAVSGGQR